MHLKFLVNNPWKRVLYEYQTTSSGELTETKNHRATTTSPAENINLELEMRNFLCILVLTYFVLHSKFVCFGGWTPWPPPSTSHSVGPHQSRAGEVCINKNETFIPSSAIKSNLVFVRLLLFVHNKGNSSPFVVPSSFKSLSFFLHPPLASNVASSAWTQSLPKLRVCPPSLKSTTPLVVAVRRMDE